MPTKRPSPPAHRSAAKAPRSHELRIIGGDWKRSKLKVLDKPGLRPTPDRVRETLFNWLGQDLSGWRCIDLFAGTGALGFEAASRGAVNVLVVEQDPALVEQLQHTQAHLKADMVRVQRGDGVAALRHSGAAAWNLVLIDPPFDSALFVPALAASAATLAAGGWVYLEAPKAWQDADLQGYGLQVHRHLKAGAVHAHLLRAIVPSAEPAISAGAA
jgi:16S rRNA (guanine(966)-N(2))-methyltransferase RsmD